MPAVSRFLVRPSVAAIIAAAAVFSPAAAQTPAPAAPPKAAPSTQAAPAPTPAPVGPDTVIARVDGDPITVLDLTVAAEDLGQQLPQQLSDEQKRDYLVNYLTDLKLAAKAANAEKLAETPEFKARLDYFRNKVMVDQYLEQAAKKGVTEEGMRKLYDETMKSAAPEMEARARHILVEGEAEAKQAYERVTKGKEDFAKVAQELSKDPGSGKEGGDLGYFTKDRMVPEFADAAFKLEPGQISEPVKSQFGWHVIKLEDKRVKPAPPFEQIKPQIEQYLTRKVHTDLILALREKGKVERLDKPAAPPAPAAPAPQGAPATPPK